MPDRSLRVNIAVNTAAQIIARGVSALTTLVITIIIARQFGASGFGDFVKITTYVAFFYLLSDFGLNAIYLQRKSEWEDLLVLRVLLSLLLVGIAYFGLFVLPRGTTQGYTPLVRLGILLFIPSIVFQALTTTGNALFQKHLRYDLSTIAVIVGSVFSLCSVLGIFLFVFTGATVLWATTAVLIGSGANAFAALLLSRRLQPSSHARISFFSIRTLFIASIPLGLTLLFNLVYFRVDSIILTLTRTSGEVGIYGLAYKIFELPLVFPTFFMNTLYPIMLTTTDVMKRKLVARASIFLFSSSLIVAGGLWICAPIISRIRPEFVSGIPALRVLSLGLPFFFLSSLAMWILIAHKKQTLLAVIYGISMIVNVCLNCLFVPAFGFMAAAWITVGSEAIVLLGTTIAVIKIL